VYRVIQVTATVNGDGTPVDLKISDALMEHGAAAVAKSVLEALTRANEESKKAMDSQVSNLLGGFGGDDADLSKLFR
jgi:DNA-binding protein YbaB